MAVTLGTAYGKGIVGALIGLALSGMATGPILAETAPNPAQTTPAQTAPLQDRQGQDWIDLLHLRPIVEVMQAEGQDYGSQLRDEMFPGQAGAEWSATVTRIYDPDRMLTEIGTVLAKDLGGDPGAGPDVQAEAQAFFGSALGQKILSLEVSARRALLDKATESAAQQTAAEMEAQNTPRFEALRRFARTNDLIELNVMGAMNANLAFYRGMSQGGAFGDGMTESDMLAEIWAQEPQVRADAEDWLWPYLALAYQPLSDEELQAYQRFCETPAGQRVNAALFAAFDTSFRRISGDLGRAAARMVQGQDI